MAANIKDEEERNRRVMMIGEFIIEHPDMSTRKTAEYFTKNFFPISNATVYDYLERYKQIVLKNGDEIRQIMYSHKAKSVEDDTVIERVMLVTREFIEKNKTVKTIAHEFDLSPWVVYYDLKIRLPLINEQLSNFVNKKMNEEVMQNLKNNESKKK